MPFDERKIIIENLTFVDEVIHFEDDDRGSCIKGLEKVKSMYPNEEIIFANGGDRNKENIPEMQVDGIEFLFSVGGDDKRILQAGFLKTGNTIKRIGYGVLSITYLKMVRK